MCRNNSCASGTRTSPSPLRIQTPHRNYESLVLPLGKVLLLKQNKSNSFFLTIVRQQEQRKLRVSYLQVNAVVGLRTINCCDINVLSCRGEGLDALELMCVNYYESPNSSQILQRTNTVRVCERKGVGRCDLMSMNALSLAHRATMTICLRSES